MDGIDFSPWWLKSKHPSTQTRSSEMGVSSWGSTGQFPGRGAGSSRDVLMLRRLDGKALSAILISEYASGLGGTTGVWERSMFTERGKIKWRGSGLRSNLTSLVLLLFRVWRGPDNHIYIDLDTQELIDTLHKKYVDCFQWAQVKQRNYVKYQVVWRTYTEYGVHSRNTQ